MRNSKQGCSTSKHNAMLDILRLALDVAVANGAAFANATRDQSVSRPAQKPKELSLIERKDFPKLLAAMRDIGGNAVHAADLTEFLAYSGARINEARNVRWSDVDFVKNTVRLRVTKNGKPRIVPMMPELKTFLERLRAARPDEPDEEFVMVAKEAQKSLDSAAWAASVPRLTHHDLRHLFATTLIEHNVDIPTIARLLGHLDGGALAMKTYGHLRDQHGHKVMASISYTS